MHRTPCSSSAHVYEAQYQNQRYPSASPWSYRHWGSNLSQPESIGTIVRDSYVDNSCDMALYGCTPKQEVDLIIVIS